MSGEKGAFRSAVSHLILPTIVLGTQPLAIIARMTRSSMLEVLGEDYIRTARAKGLSQLRVVALHAFRNALIPVITVIGLQVGVLFTGAILTETIFSWPGVGKWMIEAINRRDYPVLQGGLLMLGFIVMIGEPAGRCRLRRHQPADKAVRHERQRAAARAARRPHEHARAHANGVAPAPPGPLREFWSYFSANHGAVAGLVVVVAVLLMAAFANVLAPYPPDLTNNAAFLKPPGLASRRLDAPTCSAPTRSAATSCRGSSTARASRC